MRMFLAAALASALAGAGVPASAPAAPTPETWVTTGAEEGEYPLCHDDCFQVFMRRENESNSDAIIIYKNVRRIDFLAAFDAPDLAHIGSRRLDPESLGRPVIASLVAEAEKCVSGTLAKQIPEGTPFCFVD